MTSAMPCAPCVRIPALRWWRLFRWRSESAPTRPCSVSPTRSYCALCPCPMLPASSWSSRQLRGEKLGAFAAYFPMSYPDYVDLRDRNQSFAGLSAAQFSQVGFTARKGALPEMEVWGTRKRQFLSRDGRRAGHRTQLSGPDEDQVRGRDAVVVLGHDLWKNDLASDPDVIGKTIFLNGIAFTVVGVAPESFLGSNTLVRSALFVPLAMAPQPGGRRPTVLARPA